MKAECPRDWYTEQQVREWLNREGWPLKKDLPVFLARHFQQALEKGWQLCETSLRAQDRETLERVEEAPSPDSPYEQGLHWCAVEIAKRIRALADGE